MSKEEEIFKFPHDEQVKIITAEEKLARDIQHRKQREMLFKIILILSVVMSFVFLIYTVFIATFDSLAIKPVAIIPISLAGIIPAILLITLMRGVYRSTKPSDDHKDEYLGLAGEIAKILSTVGKYFTKL